jgi:hypothetical protein
MELWHEMLCSFAGRYTSVWEDLCKPSCVAPHCNFHKCENLSSKCNLGARVELRQGRCGTQHLPVKNSIDIKTVVKVSSSLCFRVVYFGVWT